MLIVHRVLRQASYDALHMHGNEAFNGFFFTQMTFVTVGTDDRITISRGIILYAVKHRSIVMGDEIRHNHAYHTWCFPAQALCKRIGTIVHLLGQSLHLGFHFIPNLMTAPQGSRHRGHAYTQHFGQIFQGCPTLFHAKNLCFFV